MSSTKDSRNRPQIVDLRDEANVEYWCAVWRVSKDQLTQAVVKVGNAVPAVAFALGKEAYSVSEK